MAKHETYNAFSSVHDIKAQFQTVLPKPHDWRLVSPALVGQIHGLPGSKGVAIATNGILVAIMQNQALFIGHMGSFVPDEVEQDSFAPTPGFAPRKRSAKKTEPVVDISEFV